jgi:uridine kinase
MAEALHEKKIANIADEFAKRKYARLILIAGPSSSGKPTTTIKLGQGLKHLGLKLVTLNVDNYFFDLEIHPKDEFGDFDFETPQALDLELINKHLEKLIHGEEILIPYYDFKIGKRYENQTRMKMQANEIILIDSLHGLYPAMTSSIPDEQKFKLYLEPLMQLKDSQGRYIRWTDIRLMRRMLRDAAHRAYDPRKTLLHWHYVRSSEMRNIIPYINSADFIINSAMPYELGIYREKLFNQFSQWILDYKNDPLREDAFKRAERVFNVLKEITPIRETSIIPTNSVIREFIGGSTYKY